MAKYEKIKKTLISTLCAVAVTCTGLASACTDKEKEEEKKTPFEKRTDTQTLKNGDFEYYDYPADEDVKDGKAVYLIKTPDNWTRGGDNSGTMSGIIGTTEQQWNAATGDGILTKLASNDELKSDDEGYVNYNGMRQRDLLFKDTYAALLGTDNLSSSYIKNRTFADYFGITKNGDKYYMNGKEVFISDNATSADKEGDGWKNFEFFFDSGFTKPVRKEYIANPGTHYNIKKDGDTYYFEAAGKRQELKADEKTGSLYYTNEDKEDIYVSNILMVHNYDNDLSSSGNSNSSKFNGIHQYYTSQSITLEANTAAEISVWVKTSDLKFDKGYSQLYDQDRGAFIEVTQTVGSTAIDSFKIKAINTEKIIGDSTSIGSNGWLQYKIYVNACDFASSEIKINLGLGQGDNSEKLAGYAFFDDVTVTKHLTLGETTYSDNESNIQAANAVCTLADEGDEKIFVADYNRRENDPRFSQQFNYLIDLASEKGTDSYNVYQFNNENTKAALTAHKDGSKYYVSSDKNEAKYSGMGQKDISDLNPTLARNAKSVLTENDLLGVFDGAKTFAAADFNSADYSKLLNDALTGDKSFTKLPNYKDGGNMLVLLSSWGAAYTATVADGSAFVLQPEQSVILSFWAKTHDMEGKTAATLKVYDAADKDVSQSVSIDTTNKTTDIGDKEDIYNGWVQYFVFVNNNDDEARTFNVDFSFGNTEITSDTKYYGGWAALANMQTLSIDKDVYDLAATGDNLVKLSLTKDDEKKSGNEFDAASGTSDVKQGIANLANYGGYNGGSSAVSDNEFKPVYDAKNSNSMAGLINRDYAEKYENWETIFNAFNTSSTDAVKNWGNAFGENCYQPIIIINTLRAYADEATATESSYANYYVVAEDGYTGADLVTSNGVNYKKATEYDKDETYYSLAYVTNYGFAGNTETASTDSYKAVSVRVKVAGEATAYLYLIDADREIMNFTAPAISYWYDDEGNVLDEEPDDEWKDKEQREHIVYKLRKDGLYDGVKDGKIYANLSSLTKSYDYYKYELDKVSYYDKDGNKVEYDALAEGETYYTDAAATKEAPHFLVNSENKRIYEFKDGNYYYIVKGETSKTVVNNFDSQYKRNYAEFKDGEGNFVVSVGNTNGEWVTVNFILHVSSEEKQYRLELWSGERNLTGVTVGESLTYKNGAVAFDYNTYTVDETSFNNLRTQYEKDVKQAYNKLLASKDLLGEVTSNDENLKFYEDLFAKLIADNKVSQSEYDAIKNNYTAKYYTYSLYDAANYLPFNSEVAADGETGYDYTVANYKETLAFFKYDEYQGDKLVSRNVIADYGAVEQKINIGTKTDDGEDDKTDEEKENNFGSLMLYISSIILVVALIITLISLGVAKLVKKRGRRKAAKQYSKNNYRQRQRYIRKLNLVANENVEEKDGETEGVTPEEATPEEASSEGESEGTTEESAEEAVEETSAETPAEAPEEAPAEGVTPEEASSEEAPEEKPAETDTPEHKDE